MGIGTESILDTTNKLNAQNMPNTIVGEGKQETVNKIIESSEVYTSLDSFVRFLGFELKPEMISSVVVLIIVFCLYTFFNISARKEIKELQVKQENLESNGNRNNDELLEIEEKIISVKSKQINRRNVFIVFSSLLVGMIWLGEIKNLLFSISVMLMAIVVLFKEVLTCIIGSITVSITKQFRINDRIRIDGIEGIVVDRSLFHTRLMVYEHGHNTGNEISIPNSTFITSKVILLSKIKKYNIHHFRMHVKNMENYRRHEECLTQAANEVLNALVSKLKIYRRNFEKRNLVEIPSPAPHIDWDIADKPYITIKFGCDPKYASRLEKKIKSRYLDLLYANVQEKEQVKIIVPDVLEKQSTPKIVTSSTI